MSDLMAVSRSHISILAILSVLSLLLSGCSGQNSLFGNRAARGDVSGTVYHSGNQGLVMRFIEGSPPVSLYQTDPLDVVVEYSNKGATNIESAYMYISGYDKQYITFLNDWTTFRSDGKSEFNPRGEIVDTFTFHDDAVNTPFGTDKYTPQFIVSACYKYKTEASATICIDPDPYNIQPKIKACKVQSTSMSTQGAPVAVTGVDEVISRNRVQFTITVSNVGGGDLISNTAAIENCHSLLQTVDMNRLDIRASFSDKPLICRPSPVRLTGSSGIVVCTYEGDLGKDAYQTALNIELYYGYRSSINTKTDIYRLPGQE